MLDLHNHVLFGLDDGCRTVEESRELADAAKAAGHHGFVATPHIRRGMFDNTPDDIRRRRDEAASTILDAGLELFLGAEYFFDELFLTEAKKKMLLTLGETTRYVLTEFPSTALPMRWADVLFELSLRGYVAVIAHPERCRGVQTEIESSLEAFARAGVLLQLDLGSLAGRYGSDPQKTAVRLVERGAYHVAAGDLHRAKDVDTLIVKGVAELERLLSKRRVTDGRAALLSTNPRKIVTNAPPSDIAPV